jgi:hypothetical protein
VRSCDAANDLQDQVPDPAAWDDGDGGIRERIFDQIADDIRKVEQVDIVP